MNHVEEQRNELEALSEIYYNEIKGKLVSFVQFLLPNTKDRIFPLTIHYVSFLHLESYLK